MLSGWSAVKVQGKHVEIFTPPGSPPRSAVLFLHAVGMEMPSANEHYTAAFAQFGFAVAAPFGAQAWWADKISLDFDATLTAEKYLLEHVLPFMNDLWKLGPRSIGIAGISMGGQGALRLGFKHPDQCPIVAGVASAVEHHQWYGQGFTLDAMYPTREACRQDGVILHVNPHNYPAHIWFSCDPADTDFYRGNDRLHEKLNSLGVPHQADLTTHADGHNWGYFNQMAVPMCQFLKASFDKESRRLM